MREDILIIIDPGHGGTETGAVANGIIEKVINLTVSLKLKEMLKLVGIDVVLTREEDKYLSLSDRCKIANDLKADYFISVHHNAGGGDGWEVIHTIHTDTSKGDELGEAIGREFTKTGQNMRRIFSRGSAKYPGTDYYSVINKSNMPAVITEYAFIDTKDYTAVDTAEELRTEAWAIFKGVCNFLGISYLKNAVPADTPIVKIKGEIINHKMDAQPEIKNGRVMVPVRAIAEGLGHQVIWIPEEKIVDIR